MLPFSPRPGSVRDRALYAKANRKCNGRRSTLPGGAASPVVILPCALVEFPHRAFDWPFAIRNAPSARTMTERLVGKKNIGATRRPSSCDVRRRCPAPSARIHDLTPAPTAEHVDRRAGRNCRNARVACARSRPQVDAALRKARRRPGRLRRSEEDAKRGGNREQS